LHDNISLPRPGRILLVAFCIVGAAACSTMAELLPGERIIAPPPGVQVRPPAVGQQWVYQVRNVYNQLIVDEVTETVVAVDPEVRIARTSRSKGALHDEIHAPWGKVIQDSHWEAPVTFSTPLPAWPPTLALGPSSTYHDQYQVVGDKDYSARWNLTITPLRWALLTVPAGTFTVLQFDNFIDFTNDDLSVVASERRDSVWFAPEIGRWVLRRSHGTYTMPGRGSDFHEDYFQWELKAWR
jgi:hypothetical protein